MATKRKRGSKWEFVVRCKAVRDKPFYFTFDDEAEGDSYCARLESLMRHGIVPPELIKDNSAFKTVADVIHGYVKSHGVGNEDSGLLGILLGRIGKTPLSAITYVWVEAWITEMKVLHKLAPTTIRHYVGALARCFDWASRRGVPELAVNPLRLLPRGYSIYNEHDRKLLQSEARVDVARDRRLEGNEETRIRAILMGGKHPDRQRPLKLEYAAALECMFDVALETAMRMRETYTLTPDQVNFGKRTIFLEKTKNGDKRQVPMSTVLIAKMKAYIKHVEDGTNGMANFSFASGYFFPWWNGSVERAHLQLLTAKLSQQFARIFNAAGASDVRYHDLRHEATSRLFERTTLSEGEIMKITGHKSIRMLLRYANLRGSNLADKIW